MATVYEQSLLIQDDGDFVVITGTDGRRIRLSEDESNAFDEAVEACKQAVAAEIFRCREGDRGALPRTTAEFGDLQSAIVGCLEEHFAQLAGKRRPAKPETITPAASPVVAFCDALTPRDEREALTAIEDLRRCVNLRRAS